MRGEMAFGAVLDLVGDDADVVDAGVLDGECDR